MANIVSDLKSEILRIAKREAKSEITKARKSAAEYRSEAARLKRLLQQKEREIKRLKKQKLVEDDELAGIRFSAKSVKSQRRRLGLSLEEYSMLLDVAPLTLRNWEAGKSRPRKAQLLRLVAIRGIPKGEANQRLAEIDAEMKKQG